jgi:hypothetical protein
MDVEIPTSGNNSQTVAHSVTPTIVTQDSTSRPRLEPNTDPENLSKRAIGAPTSSSLEHCGTGTRENLFTQEAPTTRAGHIRCTHDFAMLSECTCRAVVTQDEISAERDVICCRRLGCETKWVSLTPPKDEHGLTYDFSTIFSA